jgi:uncharacterized protein YkwD
MTSLQNWRSSLSTLVLATMLAACGGGGGDSNAGITDNGNIGVFSDGTSTADLQQETGAPAFTGNTANDGFNWTNFRRQQAGIPTLTRSSTINVAAQGHSDYQRRNNIITHDQVPGDPGFTGAQLLDRLRSAGYVFGTSGGIAGEIIAAANNSSGFYLAEELVTAIYHRFVMFEPAFTESGTGAATATNGRVYFTNNLTANGVRPRLGVGNFAVYPVVDQINVATVFFSNQEEPDPVPEKDAVGYPISVHADFTANLVVTSFTVRPRGGANLNVKLLTKDNDVNTAASGPAAAAIIPMDVLAAGTTYEVTFAGRVDNVPVSKNWSFTTR